MEKYRLVLEDVSRFDIIQRFDTLLFEPNNLHMRSYRKPGDQEWQCESDTGLPEPIVNVIKNYPGVVEFTKL